MIQSNIPVSIHAPAEGATHNDNDGAGLIKFQSTRPRRARPEAHNRRHDVRLVSIHAPAEGATVRGLAFRHPVKVSIHAPAEGATILFLDCFQTTVFQSTRPRRARLLARMATVFRSLFQSTRPRRARLWDLDSDCQDDDVSIHAPAEGAT